jgi:hypothetical protein
MSPVRYLDLALFVVTTDNYMLIVGNGCVLTVQ